MSTIDNNIVSMTFDNASFEKRLADTIKSLDSLRQSLDMANSTRGLEDLGKAASNFKLGNIATSIESVSGKFLALATIGVTALTRITNAAINAGQRIVSALTLDPIKDGYREYETNMNSIQTILANTKDKGGNLETVNAALDQLNEYSDQTIYNFSEMARNIGTFTAAGVGLDQSVNAIKGIANLAAISGSNSQQASTAMYQLSQALAAGKVNLMDWNSVVNAGMGGEVFKKALFETGKAMKTITDVPLTASFDEWEEKGGTFREQMEKGWLTADVLSTTLEAFSGNLDAAALQAIGFSEAAAQKMVELGELGIASATEVKTLTQLISTVKESVASGWSQSFRTVIGDFEEAKELFTGINNAIGSFVGASSDARNALLQGWKDMGGRTLLIQSLSKAFYALGRIIKPIQEAFRTVFPRATSEQLYSLTQAFAVFVEKLIPSLDTIDKLKRGFQGFFYGIKIGVEILKGIAGVIGDVISAIIPEGAGGGILGFFADFGTSITNLYGRLLSSQGIPEFFENLSSKLTGVVASIKEFFSSLNFVGLEGFEGALDLIGQILDRVRDRFASLLSMDIDIGAMLGPFEGIFNSIKDLFEEIWDYISNWFSTLGDKMAGAAEEGDYSKVLDTLNVGLLAGITAILAKFLKNGIGVNVDFLGPDLVKNINNAFGALTKTMEAMQTNIKATALLKIAGAIALLTASVVVLSMIDSAALTKALAAMAVGFGQLVGSMMIITKMDLGPMSAAKMSIIGAGLIALAGALLLLSVAVKILSTMSWEELAKGLLGVTVLLGALSVAAKVLSANSAGLIRAGLAMIPLAIALNLLAISMKMFATMSWEEMGKGLLAVGVSLGFIAKAMQKMPKTLPATAAGLVLVGVALNLIATSMLIFATMEWEEIGKGLASIAGALLIIAGAMHLMPVTLPVTAAGLVLVGAALNLIALAMKSFGGMDWEEIGRGLSAMGGSLLILALGTNAMNGAIGGAIALGIVAGALLLLTRVVTEFSKLSISELAIGLLGMAAAIGILAGMSLLLSAAIIPMMGLGAALMLVGAGFALFGAGVSLIARGVQILAKAGKAGVEVFLASLELMLTTLPKIAKAVAEGIIQFLQTFLEGLPVILEQLGIIVGQIIDTLIELIPKFLELVGTLITSLLEYIIENAPLFVEAGMTIILSLLQGISDNIEEITQTVIDMVLKFIDTLTDNMGDIVEAGATLLAEFLRGIANNINTVASAVGDIVIAFINAVVGTYLDIVKAGADAIVKFVEGIASNVLMVIDAGFQVVIDFLNGLADSIESNRGELAAAGLNLLDAIFGGVISFATDTVIPWFTAFPKAVLGWIGNVGRTLWLKGWEIIKGLYEGIIDRVNGVRTWFQDLGEKLLGWIGDTLEWLYKAGRDIIRGLWNGIKSMSGWLGEKAKDIAGWVINPVGKLFEFGSPSRLFMRYGEYIGQGLGIGIENEYRNIAKISGTLGRKVIDNFTVDEKELTSPLRDAIKAMVYLTKELPEFEGPVITPVLDLTGIQSSAKLISDMITPSSVISPTVSFQQASTIAATRVEVEAEEASAAGTNLVFNQNNYSPKALSTSDIYRQTRNQISLAKEELSIP